MIHEVSELQNKFKAFHPYDLETIKYALHGYVEAMRKKHDEGQFNEDALSKLNSRIRSTEQQLKEVTSLLDVVKGKRKFTAWKRTKGEVEVLDCQDKNCSCRNCFNNTSSDGYESADCRVKDCSCINCKGSTLFRISSFKINIHPRD